VADQTSLDAVRSQFILSTHAIGHKSTKVIAKRISNSIVRVKKLNTDEAINLIRAQIDQIDNLESVEKSLSGISTKWRLDTLLIIQDIFGKNSDIVKAFNAINFEFVGNFEYDRGYREQELFRLDYLTYLKGLLEAKGVLESGISLLERKGIESVYDGKDTPKEASELLKIVSLIENSLRKVIRDKPTKEKEVNDALEALFIGAGFDGEFSREKEHIEYSSKNYIPDFVFKRIETIVESKFCDKPEREKEMIGEINDDIVAYQTKYPNLIFVVYDVGVIRDADKFKEGIENQKSVIIKIIKH